MVWWEDILWLVFHLPRSSMLTETVVLGPLSRPRSCSHSGKTWLYALISGTSWDALLLDVTPNPIHFTACSLAACPSAFSSGAKKTWNCWSAKRSQLRRQGIADPSDAAVIDHITKRELALHCRRKTRGVVQTATMIYDLLMTFTAPRGCDSNGVPLLNNERMWQIWDCQQRHIECIQDPEGVQLYTQTGVITKGDIHLPTYRCARGSTSLESFHLHINRFIPGIILII